MMGVGSLAILTGAFSTALGDWAVAAVLMVGALGLLLTLARGHLAPWHVSPVLLFAAVYLGMATLGPIVYPLVSNARSGASIRLPLQPSELAETSEVFLLAAVAFLAGAVVSAQIAKSARRRPAALRQNSAAGEGWFMSRLGPGAQAGAVPLAVVLSIAALSVGATVIGTGGVHVLLDRPFYIEGRTASREFFTIGQWLGIPAVIGLALLPRRAERWPLGLRRSQPSSWLPPPSSPLGHGGWR